MRKKYDCTKCLHEAICELWREYEGQCAASFRSDGKCDHYRDKSRYICVDDLKGPGPDPRGPEGNLGYVDRSEKEATQCGDASGRGND